MNSKFLGVAFGVLLMGFAMPMVASAGPIYSFSVSTGSQPSNVGTITLTQVDANTVGVLVDLNDTTAPAPQYGFVNTGGPHTPFAFQISGSEAGVTATFQQPAGGVFGLNLLTLNLAGGDNTPFGTFGIAIDSSGGNGSNTANAYYGDLQFSLFRPTGLSTDDFIQNLDGVYFSADLTNGPDGGTTGAQAWINRSPGIPTQQSSVPEPASMLLLGTGLLAAARARRRNA